MTEDANALLNARAAVEEAQSQFGNDDLRVSYKLDELAAILKAQGRLLDAANASARARTIRSASVARESEVQEHKFGAISENQHLSARAWLMKLRAWALVACAVLLFVVYLFPAHGSSANMVKGLVGSSMAATCFQLFLYPVDSIPRFAKWLIVVVGSGIVGMIMFR